VNESGNGQSRKDIGSLTLDKSVIGTLLAIDLNVVVPVTAGLLGAWDNKLAIKAWSKWF